MGPLPQADGGFRNASVQPKRNGAGNHGAGFQVNINSLYVRRPQCAPCRGKQGLADTQNFTAAAVFA